MKKRKRLQLDGEEDGKSPFFNDVDYAQMEMGLRIDKNALDDAFIEQAQLMQDAAERYAIALAERDGAKDYVKVIEAKLYVQIRDQYADKGKGRGPSENMMKSLVEQHTKRREAMAAYLSALEAAAKWEGMFESYKARGYALGELNKLYLAGYFTVNSAKAAAAGAEHDEFEMNRHRIREARKARHK